MLITITDLHCINGAVLRRWHCAKYALCHNNTMILSMSQEGACQALNMHNTPGGPTNPPTPVAREPTLDELRQWFHWQAEHGRTNQRFVEGGLPWPADD